MSGDQIHNQSNQESKTVTANYSKKVLQNNSGIVNVESSQKDSVQLNSIQKESFDLATGELPINLRGSLQNTNNDACDKSNNNSMPASDDNIALAFNSQ